MAAKTRTSKELQTAGAILVVVGGLAAWGLTWIPVLFATSTTEYLALIPLSAGGRGLEAGGPVLYGGAPRGTITSVRTERDPTTGMPSEIRVGFALDSALPLAADATISKSTGIAGTNTAIAISDPGTPRMVFRDDQERILRVKRTDADSGSAAVTLLGRENSRLLTEINEALARMGNNLPPKLTAVGISIRKLQAILVGLQIEIGSDVDRQRARFAALIAEGRGLEKSLQNLQSGILKTQKFAGLLETDIDVATQQFVTDGKLVEQNMDLIHTQVLGIEQALDHDFAPKLRSMQRELISTIDESRRLIGTTKELLPEFAASIEPSMARMTLAGGQLVLVFDNLLPIVIEAILVSPDSSSESRRRTLEAVQDAVMAGSTLRDAARRLDSFTTLNQPLLKLNPDLAPLVSDPLSDAIADLEKMLKRLVEVLRREIQEPRATPSVTAP
jgi:hypothetical protein